MTEQIYKRNCKECLHFEACSKWTDFPKQVGFPVCRKYRKQSEGEWMENKECCIEYKCSLCEYEFCRKTNFCPNCGAKMKGEEDEG